MLAGRAANLEGAGAAAMNELETQMRGRRRSSGKGRRRGGRRRAVADVPQAGRYPPVSYAH